MRGQTDGELAGGWRDGVERSGTVARCGAMAISGGTGADGGTVASGGVAVNGGTGERRMGDGSVHVAHGERAGAQLGRG